MSLARRLRQENASGFAAALAHPFVTGIGDGSLPRHYFARWLAQDWLYLQGYVEALEAAGQLADTEEARLFWHDLAQLTRDVELDHHQALAARFGLSSEDLDRTQPFEATTAYLNFLKRAGDSYATLVAALTPCAIGYAEIAQELARRGPSPDLDYQSWIDTYIDPAFQQSVQGFTAELERAASLLKDLRPIEEAYAHAVQCELDFWQGLWTGR